MVFIARKNDAAAAKVKAMEGRRNRWRGNLEPGSSTMQACEHLERISKQSVGVRQRRDDTLKTTLADSRPPQIPYLIYVWYLMYLVTGFSSHLGPFT